MTAIEDRTTSTPLRPNGRARPATRLVWIVAAAGLCGVAILAWAYLGETASSPLDAISGVSLLLSLAAFIVSGAVIVVRRPGNVIGWLLMIPGLTAPASEVTLRWLGGLTPPTEVGPGLWLALYLSGIAWLALIFPIFHILLTFPTGRLLSARWRAAVALELTMIGTLMFIAAFTVRMGPSVNDEQVWSVPNPIGFLPEDSISGPIGVLWQVGLLALCVLGGTAIVLRFRRGTREERQQLKWPVAGFLVFGATYALASLQLVAVGVVFALGISSIPVSVAIAVTRYRLYEIDRLIGRTVAYALMTAALAGTFLLTNIALQSVFARGTTFEVAVSTLVVAMLFQPLRGAIQRPIDRRFNRAQVDAEQLIAGFVTRTRDEVDLERLVRETRRVATGALEPMSTGLWLRGAVR